MSEPKHALAGRVAIITGAGRGLGRAMALGLAAAGASVVATSARSLAEVEAVAAEASDNAIVPVRADVTREEDCAAAVEVTVARFGRLDVLVNNAGRGMRLVSDDFLTTPTRFWEVGPAVWRDIVDTNVNGPFLMARAAVPALIASGRGRIVNISMNHETMRRAGFSPYGPSKAALESETVIWAQDLAATGVTVNALLPGGATETGLIPSSVGPEARAGMLRPTIVVPPLLWLASDASHAFTGRRIDAKRWRSDLPPADAARKASELAGWVGGSV
ncbi:SDR family NAD(P)-dependent oxidoreductase [Lichenibacterium dinghuense]|uniref:SDR family NAD(P)-dependent oxidoreductase n=1 Tax=Lichenibacterium dinghuense TaxID=2895977 RepID=UPI001F2C5B5A|nr:SDR family oxidoreductase [Lichenibacterium sp. 6Y81]